MSKPLLIFVVAEDWYFYSHRLPMARAARDAGFDVAVAVPAGLQREKIEQEGFRVLPTAMRRGGLNPLRALSSVAELYALYRKERPHLVHHVAMKPVLFGSVAARMARVPRVINAFAGLGFIFTEETLLARSLRAVLVPVFRVVLRQESSMLLLQNPDDLATLCALGVARKDRSVIIRGSGVDLNAYAASPLPDSKGGYVCVFAGRMIDIKGLATLKEAFRIIRRPDISLWLCGAPDPANPASWTQEALKAWQAEDPRVVYRGASDMKEIWPKTHLALQPSWGGEGVPKAMLEAAASGRAIVATDVPGCREVVRQGFNGYLVPPRDAQALADAILRALSDEEALKNMGENSRTMVEGELSSEGVAALAREMYAGAYKSG